AGKRQKTEKASGRKPFSLKLPFQISNPYLKYLQFLLLLFDKRILFQLSNDDIAFLVIGIYHIFERIFIILSPRFINLLAYPNTMFQSLIQQMYDFIFR